MLVVRLLWIAAGVLAIAAGAFYVADNSTAAWYIGIGGTFPLFILIALRVLAIEKRKDEPARLPPGWLDGSGPFGPP